jgi:hypothetical protein
MSLGQQEGDLEKGARFESLGFTWCKIGSIALIALFPRPALLLASALAIYYYARALALGVTRSCCILRHPAIIMAFWTLVFAATMGVTLWPAVAAHLGR